MQEVLTIRGLPSAADSFLYGLTVLRKGNDIDIRIYESEDIDRVSAALAEFILRTQEGRLLKKFIDKSCNEFMPAQQTDILDIAKKSAQSGRSIKGNICYNRRRNMIIKAMREYFEKNGKMVFDGFINFRLREYMRELKTLAEAAVDDYVIMQEYNEFIELLRFFVVQSKNRYEKIHVFANDKDYEVFDQSLCPVELEDGQMLGLSRDDLLISTLISLAPKTVIVHQPHNIPEKILNTIELIFSPGVVCCSDAVKS